MTTENYAYPFDPTGTNPANLIVNEQQVITAVNAEDYHTIIPRMAPFFVDGLTLVYTRPDSVVVPLVEGVDYYFTHNFISASRACSKPVYGSITFLDNSLAGVVRLSYQTIGGLWTLDSNAIAEILANLLKNPRTTAWEQVTDIPVMFPVIDHEWNLVDMVGVSALITSIEGIKDAILASTGGGLAAHIANTSNPHQVNKTQIGLGNVQNYPIATESQATGGTNNTTYMTPLLVKKAIDAFSSGVADITSHINNTNNPHAVTKTQVGLGNVQNYGIATDSDMLAGVSTSLYVTPANVALITNAITTVITSHINNTNNPHGVTKDQVGLYNVQNYGIATTVEATDGTSDIKYMTPLKVKQAITQFAIYPLNAHMTDTNNPHAVNKTQIGLGNVQNYSIATQLQVESGTDNASYMTPLRTHDSIMFFVGNNFIDHLNATNPHNVTANQTGAYSSEQVDLLLDQKLDITATASNSAKLEGSTLAQVLSQSASNVIDNFAAPEITMMGYANDPANGVGYSWVRLGSVSVLNKSQWDAAEAQNSLSDINWIVSGGEELTSEVGAIYHVTGGMRKNGNQPWLNVQKLHSNDADLINFYYSVVNIAGVDRMYVYATVKNGSAPLSVVSMHRGGSAIDISYLGTNFPSGTSQATVYSSYQKQIDDLKNDIVSGFNAITQLINNL